MFMAPSSVLKVPVTPHRGQNLCHIEPQGLDGSVPYVLVPFLPAMKPGHWRVKVTSMLALELVEDFIEYERPSSASSIEHPSA